MTHFFLRLAGLLLTSFKKVLVFLRNNPKYIRENNWSSEWADNNKKHVVDVDGWGFVIFCVYKVISKFGNNISRFLKDVCLNLCESLNSLEG